jgi:hypothetical protein
MDDYYKALNSAKSSSSSSASSGGGSAKSGGSSTGSKSYLDEYKSSLQNILENPSSVYDIAPVLNVVTSRMTVGNKKKEEKKKVDFLQKGAFEDGYQFGDLTKTILGTAGDAGLSVVKGVGGLAEGLVDLVDYGIAGVADLAGADEWADGLRKVTQESLVDKATQKASDYLDQYSVLGRTSDAILQGVGQVGGIMLTGGLAAGAGLSSAGVSAVTSGVMGLSGMGSGMGEAYQNGATDGEAVAYGAISGAADALTEMMFGGMGKAVNALGFSKGLSSADDMLAKVVSDKFKNQIAKNFVEFGIKASAEGLEEVVAGTAQAFGKKLTYMSEKDMKELLNDENLLEQFIVGSVTSGMIQAGFVPGTQNGSLIEANKQGADFLTGNTKNEMAVIEKLVADEIAKRESEGNKVSGREKSNIEADIVRDMEKGRISTDTIEEVLGGEAYDKYMAALANQKDNDFINSYEELSKKTNPTTEDVLTLSEMKPKYKAINDYRIQTKAELSSKVSEFVRNDRLAESYRESDRRKQKFEADVTKYDEKQREIVQKAIDSGVLNNTNRSHEFVDVVAKISADKGVPFDFTNNAKLKESGFAVEGATVDGFVNENGITINMESPKAWQTTVGHEVSHVLEGTEFYSELQNVLFEYAKRKGDYKARYDALTERYKEVYKDISPEEYEAKINAEVTSDLIGEYLFTDENFVNNLTANKNVFQKIYDEIKYLAKIVTAGSKEARDIERIKKAFDKAYKEAAWEKTDMKYSLSSETDTPYMDAVNRGDNETARKMVDEAAKKAGYNSGMLYHGTPKFGFTWFDLDRMDDGISIFATSDSKIAESYSGETDRTTISDRELKNVNEMSDSELLKYVQRYIDPDYQLATDSQRETLIRSFTESFDTIRQDLLQLAEDNADSIEQKQLAYLYEFADIVGKMSQTQDASEIGALRMELYEKMGWLRWDAPQVDDLLLEDSDNPLNGSMWKENWLDNATRQIAQNIEEISKSDSLFVKNDADSAEYLPPKIARKQLYSRTENGIYALYANTDNVLEFDAQGGAWNKIDGKHIGSNGVVTTREVSKYAKENGYNGVVIRNLMDAGGKTNYFEASDIYILFDNTQVKSADTVTYDDSGNVIPLSERFNAENKDIRYSLTDKNAAPVSGSYATPASDLMYAPVAENSIVEQETQLSEENSTVSKMEKFAPSVPTSTAEQEVAATTEPKTTAEKARDHYRDDILNRGDILSKLVNSGKTTMKAVTDATKQAQTLISKGADGVKSIGEIFGRISTDGKLGDFEDYLHHLLNVDRRTLNDRFGIHDRPVWGYSAEESQKRADKLAEENPEFVKAAEDVYAFNDYIMRVRVQSGKITQEQADIWKQYYPHYVPISRGGADAYQTLLKFAEGDTTAIKTIDVFANEADLAADVHRIKRQGEDFDALMDTMVNAAFTAHWGLAISNNGVTAPVQTQTSVDAPVADTAVETQTEEDYVPSAEKVPSPDAVQPADHESIKLMEQHDGVRGKLDDAVHWVEDNVLDNGRVFEKIDYKKGNRNLYSHWHAIRNAFSSAQYFIGNGNASKGVRALNDIYSEIKKKGLTEYFDMYLAHQRNIDGMTMQARYGVAANRDFIKGVSAAQSYKEVLTMETVCPQFKQWANDIYANTGYVIDQMVEHKMLSQDMADLFKELYPHYVPMRYGKNGALESSLESLGQFTVEAFNSFAMNDFGLELKHTLRSEINREDMNIDTFINLLDSGTSLFDFDVNGMDEDYHTFTVYEDGELKTFDITREMYMAMNQTRNWMDWKIPVLYQVNEGFRKATTELNWIFAATNGIKDPQEILWNSQHPLETYAKFLPAEAAVWSKDSKYRHYYEEYLANGGESVEYFNPNNNKFDADKGVFAYLNQKIGTGAISKLNGRVETAPRLAEYIASREAGKSVQEAMLDAAQVTVNFQAGGKLTKFLNRNGCTFLNASVQGALQHVRNIQEGKQNAWKGVSAMIAKGMVAGLGSELVKQINHLLWDDDDEYENLPDYIKQDYYLFGKFGDGTWLRLPKGRTNATVEEAIRQVALSSTGDDEADWDNFWKLFIENMAPNNPITNNLLAPILEVKSNTTWYGEDLVPSRLRETRDEDGNLKEIPVTEQYDEKTDAFSVWLGEQLDYSPKKINYLINSYTGVIGDTLLPMGTPKAESPDDSLLGKLIAPLRDKFTTDAVLNHRATEDFYEELEAAEAKAESKSATQQDKFESGMLIGYNVELSKLYAKQREIQMDKSLKNSEKYELTREIKKEINDLQEKALEALDDYSIDGIYGEAGDKRYNYDSENDTWWEVKPKTSKGEDNPYYIDEQLFHDYLGVDYADYWNGRKNPEDYDVKSLYAERDGKRYNFDMDDNRWYEIKPKNDDGTDNYYYQQEQRITKDLGISSREYWNNRKMYDDFYYIAGGYEKDDPEDDRIETARAVFGYEEFAKYAADLKEIKADKDSEGNIITSSKWPKVQAYVNSLDIPDIEKKILYTIQYPNYKKYKKEIVKYLDENDDISYESFYKILDELKYKVDSNGRVTWY